MINKPQPPPLPTDRTATWDLILADMRAREPEPELHAAILRDMVERDAIGAAKYGVRHTSHNGRDNLIDAYQEHLDAAVYLRAEMAERGITLREWATQEDFEVRGAYEMVLGNITHIRRILLQRYRK